MEINVEFSHFETISECTEDFRIRMERLAVEWPSTESVACVVFQSETHTNGFDRGRHLDRKIDTIHFRPNPRAKKSDKMTKKW